MLINRLINVDEDFDSGEVTEPVTLQEVKDYLRLGGFVSDDSGEQEFDFDDTLLEAMISEGRMWLEKFTNQFIVPRSITAVLLNQAGGFQLKGPVSGAVVYTDNDDVVITTLTVVGDKYPKIISRYGSCLTDRITATYEAGYGTYPAWVGNAVKAYVADHYEWRGDDKSPAPNERAAAIARAHRKGGTGWA